MKITYILIILSLGISFGVFTSFLIFDKKVENNPTLNGVATTTVIIIKPTDINLEVNGGYGTDYLDIRCYNNYQGKRLLCLDIYDGSIKFEN